jgi:magnesium-transporting ATPase (P-type)
MSCCSNPGDRIPADLRLVDVKNLRTEEAALTGESVPIDKTTVAVAEKATVGDREGMAFSGTLVSSGRGTGVVVATGSNTELGRINQLMAAVSALDTPLLRQIKKFGYVICRRRRQLRPPRRSLQCRQAVSLGQRGTRGNPRSL